MDRFAIRSPVIIHETLNGEVVAVNLEEGIYHSTSGTGAQIWAAEERRATTAAIVDGMMAEGLPRCRRGLDTVVTAFLRELMAEGLIIRFRDRERSRCRRRPFRLCGAVQSRTARERFADVTELILLDLVHKVEEGRGWAHAKPPV